MRVKNLPGGQTMATRDKPPVLVVLQLTGGNDYMNTVVPYTDPNYYDSRTTLGIDQESVLRSRRRARVSPQHGAGQGDLRPRRHGRDSRRGLRQLATVALPLDGHLAHLRAGHHRHRGLAGPCAPRPRSGWRKPGDRSQHRPGYAQGPAGSRRVGRVSRRPFDLRTANEHRATRATRQDADPVRQHVRAGHRHRPSPGLPRPDRTGRAQGRRHTQRWTGQVLIQRRVLRTTP